MGKILEYVILLSNLSIILATQSLKDTTLLSNYEKEKRDNFTLEIKEYLPKNQNDGFIKKIGEEPSSYGFYGRRRSHPSKFHWRPKQMTRTPGLQAFATKESFYKSRRNPSLSQWTNKFSDSWKTQNLTSERSKKPDWRATENGQKEKISKFPLDYNQSNSFNNKNNFLEKDNRRYHHNGRSARFNHVKHSPKICDPCNSVPWVPLFKVPDSYRQQRTHVPESPKPINHDFNFDYKAFASSIQNVLIPPLPIVPSLEPIYDGTISSSFGLPIGNIPTGHGLLAPINPLATKINRYGANSIDFSNSIKFIPTQSFLESNSIPLLSPVPVVPIHDSSQFYQYDSSITDLMPPTAKPVDVSKVVLTISEGDPVKLNPDSVPHSTGSVPHSTGSVPHSTGSVPHSTGSVPHNTGSVPHSTGSVPHSTGSIPLNPDSVPHSTGSVPHSTGSVPHSTGSVPHSTGSVPLNPDSVPHSTGSVPLNPDSVPYSAGSVHVNPGSVSLSKDSVPLNIGSVHFNPGSVQLNPNLGKDLNPASSSLVDFPPYTQDEEYPPLNKPNLGKFEIIKSIPLAEFKSTVNYPLPSLQIPSINPFLQNQFVSNIYNSPPKPNHYFQKEISNYNNIQNHTEMNFLVPPLIQAEVYNSSFNSSKNEVFPFLNPPKNTDSQFQESVKSSTVPRPLTSPSLSWLFSDNNIQSTTSKSTQTASHQFTTEIREIASIVNNELRPVSSSSFPTSPSSSDSSKSKKIQIIIPYTTKNKNGPDNNALESIHHEVFQTVQPPVSISTHENDTSHDILATSAFPPLSSENHLHLSSTNRDRKVVDVTQNPLTFSEEHSLEENFPESHRYLSEMQHIIASNIRELLKEEIEKSQSDQNYPLQNNIDNWTALEYSNHKTVGEKAPKEIISQALAVTSIPGTSISHLLLPSKKIPNEYFITTPLPIYDEPDTPIYRPTNSSVNSKPFTAKPYATTNLYHPTKNLRQSTQDNHERNYTEVVRGKVNNWGRLNENLVLPEARTRKLESTTVSSWTNSFITGEREKIQIVTPVSSTSIKNYTTQSYRRTTRQIHTTEEPMSTTTETKANSTTTFTRLNSTKLEKVSNLTSIFNKKAFFRRTNSSQKLNFIKGGLFNRTQELNKNQSDTTSNQTLVLNFPGNITDEEIIKLTESESRQFSINDIFPFRNKELPWEMKLNITQANFRNGRQRKSLIKQTKSLKPNSTIEDSS